MKKMSENVERHVISKKRVTDYGEVYTQKREVTAMLDLVRQETERIESCFLEPACGTGNFLKEILERKLKITGDRYRKSQLEFERYAVIAVASLYGIDILEDNVKECRKRLYGIFDWKYAKLFSKTTKNECRNSVKFILNRNIIWGDALTLKTMGENPQPIVFSEWSLVNSSMIKRRDFSFGELLGYGDETTQISMFKGSRQTNMFSDLGEKCLIPQSIKDYPLMHFLKLGEPDES